MNVKVVWSILSDDDDRWNTIRCLYAYLAPNEKEILYIGKSWGDSVRQRWNRSGKEKFWDDLEEQRGIKSHIALIGEVALEKDRRLSDQLLADIESLLIFKENPWGNIQSTNSRTSRPGMFVECSGQWPSKKMYYDV